MLRFTPHKQIPVMIITGDRSNEFAGSESAVAKMLPTSNDIQRLNDHS